MLNKKLIKIVGIALGALILLIIVPSYVGRSSTSGNEENLPDAVPSIIAEGLPPIIRLQEDGQDVCTATVVFENYAVTAAHCIKRLGQEFGVAGDKTTLRAVSIQRRLDRAVLLGDLSKHTALVIDLYGDGLHSPSVAVVGGCGYPAGSPELLCPLGQRVGFDYFSALWGFSVLPGMSGGAVIEPQTKMVIGIINGSMQDGAAATTTTTGIFDWAGIKIKRQ